MQRIVVKDAVTIQSWPFHDVYLLFLWLSWTEPVDSGPINDSWESIICIESKSIKSQVDLGKNNIDECRSLCYLSFIRTNPRYFAFLFENLIHFTAVLDHERVTSRVVSEAQRLINLLRALKLHSEHWRTIHLRSNWHSIRIVGMETSSDTVLRQNPIIRCITRAIIIVLLQIDPVEVRRDVILVFG